MKLIATSALCLSMFVTVNVATATDLVVATVNNGHMIEMAKLGKFFEKDNPDIKLKWVTLQEAVLRKRVTTDIAKASGQFDVMTIGMYEAPIWGKRDWLVPLELDIAYDVDDLLPSVCQSARRPMQRLFMAKVQ